MQAQNSSNQIGVTSVPLTTSLTTASQLETEIFSANAITVTTNSQIAYRVFVRLTNMSTTSGTPFPASMIAMQLASSDKSNRSVPVTSKIALSLTDQLLITDTDKTRNGGDFFYYNIFLGPIGYSYGPGVYTSTILFTMSQP